MCADDGDSTEKSNDFQCPESSGAKALQACTAVVFDFLQSKGLFAAERALRTELEVNDREMRLCTRTNTLISRNLWQSKIERMLDVKLPKIDGGAEGVSPDMAVLLSEISCNPVQGGATPTIWHHTTIEQSSDPDASRRSTPSRRLGVRLHNLNPASNAEEGLALRRQRTRSAQQSCVVFREGLPMSEAQAQEVETLALPLLYNPYIRGLEDSPELALDEDTLIAGRYRVAAMIGKGSFSRVVQCYDHKAGHSVSVKVLHNDKDCIDQGIGEIRLLSLLAQRDPTGEVASSMAPTPLTYA